MPDDDIEELRRHKMLTLKAAREAYRHRVTNPPLESGSLFEGQLDRLRDAVRKAEEDLRSFNREHPRS